MEEEKEYLVRYTILYTFPERYGISNMKRDVLSATARRASKPGFTTANVSTTNYVYEHILPRDGLRRLLVCIYKYKVDSVWLQENKMEDFYLESPDEFVLDLVVEMGCHKASPGQPSKVEGVTFMSQKKSQRLSQRLSHQRMRMIFGPCSKYRVNNARRTEDYFGKKHSHYCILERYRDSVAWCEAVLRLPVFSPFTFPHQSLLKSPRLSLEEQRP